MIVSPELRAALIAEGWIPPERVKVAESRNFVASEMAVRAYYPEDLQRQIVADLTARTRAALPIEVESRYDFPTNAYEFRARIRYIEPGPSAVTRAEDLTDLGELGRGELEAARVS